MKIIIKTKNLELTDFLDQYINKKIGTLEKFLKNFKDLNNNIFIPEIFVEIEKETRHHRKGDLFVAKTQIILPNKSLIAKAKGDDLLLAIVKVKDELQEEIKKYKSKKIDLKIKNKRIAKEILKQK